MNRLTLFLVSAVLFVSCSDSKKLLNKPGNTTANKSDATPVDEMVPVGEPWVYFGTFPYVSPADKTLKTDKPIQALTHDNTLLGSLCGWRETTTVLDITGSVSLQAPVITANVNGEKYQVIYSFKKFTNVDSGDSRVQVGVEVRLTASFSTLKGAVNLSLSGLGTAASAGRLSGSMTLSLVGASLPKIGEAFTATSSITAESIEKVLQQISTLKTMVFENDAIITPYVLAIQDLTSVAAPNWDATQKKAAGLRSSFQLRK